MIFLFCILSFVLLFFFFYKDDRDGRDDKDDKYKENYIYYKKRKYPKVYIYLLCFNEEYVIESTILHYRRKFPGCVITIMDNYSTDNSVDIAKKYNCIIQYWENDIEKGKISEHMYRKLKNNLWKEHKYKDAWIITCDMDEWIEIDWEELLEEDKKGTTIISTYGINIVADSKREDLKDIDLSKENKGYHDNDYSKNICFKVPDIKEINFDIGSHTISPIGNIKYSDKKYILRHMNYLGLKYLIYKLKGRHLRLSQENIKNNWGVQYTNDVEKIKTSYNEAAKKIKKE